MKKFLTIAAILLVVGFVVAKSKPMCSYVCTSVKMVGNHLKGSVTPEFEIQRLKDEVAKLDGEVDRLIMEEATLTVDLKDQRANLAKKEAALAKTEKTLLDFATEVKAKPDQTIVFTKATFTPVTAKKKLADDFELYKSLKGSVQSTKNLIEAKEKHFNTIFTQRNQIVTQKETYKAKLEQIAADWAVLKSDPHSFAAKFDNNSITMIENGLKELQRQVAIKQQAELIKNGTTPVMPAENNINNAVDAEAVLNAIQNQNEDKNTAVKAEK